MVKKQPKPKRPVGRPKVLDDESKELILETLKVGMSLADAATRVGVARSTINGEANRDPEFLTGIKRARLEGKFVAAQCFLKGASSDWKAAKDFLARTWPEEWAQRDPDAITPVQLAESLLQIAMTIQSGLPVRYHARVKNAVADMLKTLEPK